MGGRGHWDPHSITTCSTFQISPYLPYPRLQVRRSPLWSHAPTELVPPCLGGFGVSLAGNVGSTSLLPASLSSF